MSEAILGNDKEIAAKHFLTYTSPVNKSYSYGGAYSSTDKQLDVFEEGLVVGVLVHPLIDTISATGGYFSLSVTKSAMNGTPVCASNGDPGLFALYWHPTNSPSGEGVFWYSFKFEYSWVYLMRHDYAFASTISLSALGSTPLFKVEAFIKQDYYPYIPYNN